MKKIGILLIIAFLISCAPADNYSKIESLTEGNGKEWGRYVLERVDVDGVDCVVIGSSIGRNAISLSCDWDGVK